MNAIQTFRDTIDNIKALPIDQLDLRQPLLVAALGNLASHFVSCGMHKTCVMNQKWWGSLVAQLDCNGMEVLGSGFFSAAIKSPLLPGKVIKVGFKKEDSGAAYTAWCRSNQGRKGVPVVHDAQRHSHCYTVVLDELKPFSGYRRELEGDYIEVSQMLEHDAGTPKSPLGETARDIRTFFKGIASFDLHNENVMVNSRDELVITDPVSFTQGDLSAMTFEELKAQAIKVREDNRMLMAIQRLRRKLAHRLRPEEHAAEVAHKRRNRKRRNKRAKERKAIAMAEVAALAEYLQEPIGANVMHAIDANMVHMVSINMVDVRNVGLGRRLATLPEGCEVKRPPIWKAPQGMPIWGRKGHIKHRRL